MTHWEARIILGLRDEDEVTENGLDRLRECLVANKNRTLDKRHKRQLTKEIKAIDKLKDFYFRSSVKE